VDSLRIKADLQVAQTTAQVLAGCLMLMRTTVLPLLPQSAATRAADTAAQAGNGALTALAQFMQQQQLAGMHGPNRLWSPACINSSTSCTSTDQEKKDAAEAPQTAFGTAGQGTATAWPGSLAGLVCGLQADVNKLQQQLCNSNKHLQLSKHTTSSGAARQRCVGAEGGTDGDSR